MKYSCRCVELAGRRAILFVEITFKWFESQELKPSESKLARAFLPSRSRIPGLSAGSKVK